LAALAAGTDPLRVQPVFKLDATTATRCAATARRILTTRTETTQPATITPLQPPNRTTTGSIRPGFRTLVTRCALKADRCPEPVEDYVITRDFS
jgi:hypothetical protein